MPEGHTLHRLARQLQPLVGRRVRASSPQGRFADGAKMVDGRRLDAVAAYGKHMLLDFGDVHLHVHLGLAGSMFPADPAGTARPGVRLRLVDAGGAIAWDLVAPIRCELWSDGERAALLARLGPDPLRGDDPGPMVEHVTRSQRAIGQLLLDQAVVAGVGNVFRAEALHACRIHPSRPGTTLAPGELRCLWAELTRLMERATEEGRIITVDSPAEVERASIAEAEGRFVYKQERCRRCDGPVRTWALGPRTAYACELCQPAA